MVSSRSYAFVGVTFSVLVWGASFIATKIALLEIQPVTVVWLRFAMGVIILGIAVFARREFAWPGWRDLAYFSVLGFVGITFHQWLQSTALVTSQASTTAWIVATTPIFIATLGWIFLREVLLLLSILGIALATLGVLLVVTEGDLSSLLVGSFGAPGDILVLVSALNWALFSVFSRRGLSEHPASRMMFYVMLSGWIFVSALFFRGSGLTDVTHLSLRGWLAIGFLGIFCSGLAYIFWYDALKILPASQVGSFLYLEPLVAVIVAAVILGEVIMLPSILGGGLILLGVWMVNRTG